MSSFGWVVCNEFVGVDHRLWQDVLVTFHLLRVKQHLMTTAPATEEGGIPTLSYRGLPKKLTDMSWVSPFQVKGKIGYYAVLF